MGRRGKSKNKRLIILSTLLLIFLMAVILGPRFWISAKFNRAGNIFLCNDGFTRIYEMTESGLIVWSFDLPEYPREKRFWLPYPVRLSNGNTLISDGDAGSVYEVNRGGDVVWNCDSLYDQGNYAFILGSEIVALGLKNGNILAMERGDERGKVMEIDRDCNIVWQWDCHDDDPGYTERVSHVHTLQSGNTAVLVLESIVREQWEPPRLCDSEDREHIAEEHARDYYYQYIELDTNAKVVRRHDLVKPGFYPTGAYLLSNGRVFVTYDQFGVAEYDTMGDEVWSFQPPESISTTASRTGRAPMGAELAFRSSNGNTVVASYSAFFIVNPRGQVLRRFSSLTVRSTLGLRYVSHETGGQGDEIYPFICGVIGIVE